MADEYGDQRGLVRKTWWVARFAVGVALMPLSLYFGEAPTMGIAALGDNDEKARRAIAKARAMQQANRERQLLEEPDAPPLGGA